MEYIIKLENDFGIALYIHRRKGQHNTISDEGWPMVYRNRSVAKKVRQRANRIYAGDCTEIPFVPSAYDRYDIDGEVAT